MEKPTYISLADYNAQYGEELDNTTCSHEALAFLSRSDAERKMNDDEWQALYQKRLIAGYYDEHGNRKLTPEEQAEENRNLPF